MSTPEPTPQKVSFLYTLKAVAWAFLGVRSKKAYQEDIQKLQPLTLILTAVFLTLIFIGSLMFLAHLAVR